jgi:hypothetical protein
MGKFAYVANYFDNTLSAYAIDTHGALTPVAGSPFGDGFGPYAIATCRRVRQVCKPPPL